MICRFLAGAVALVMLVSTNLFAYSERFQGYNFKAYVVKSNKRHYKEFKEGNKVMLKVRPNEEYSIVVHNPLPVRVAVAVAIDGLNSIDGKRTSPRNAQKWMIAPNSSITVSGWQTSKKTLRKFLFTEDTAAYAQWREDREGKPYGKNMGVIGVAWFWNSQELDRELHPPEPFISGKAVRSDLAQPARGAKPSAKRRSKAAPRAGTGMGQEQQHRVTEVQFNANAGMFSVKDVMKIYYEFAKEPPVPLPFIDEERDTIRFAPDMPK
ncbi:hypothetical protein KAR34_07685 [bacterium]|nr:hypothetical protein [bacterium]